MIQNIFFTSLRYIVLDVVGDIIYFPIWWYTKGLKNAAVFCGQRFKNGAKVIGLNVWLTNLFRPMFGVRDWQGRIISFFMRLVQIIFRSIATLIWVVIMLAVFIIYLLLPVFIVYQIGLVAGII